MYKTLFKYRFLLDKKDLLVNILEENNSTLTLVCWTSFSISSVFTFQVNIDDVSSSKLLVEQN